MNPRVALIPRGVLPPARRMAALLLLLCILPSLLILFVPIYDEDVGSVLFTEPFGFGVWLKQGRPVWNLIHLLTPESWRCYPTICLPLALVYTTLYGLFVALLGRFFSRLLRAPRLGWFGAAFVGLHFFFLEGRIWNGHFMLLGADIVLAAILFAWRLRDRRPARLWTTVPLLVAAGVLLALNCHQSGAFIAVSLIALAFALRVLGGPGEKAPDMPFWRAVTAGFVAACLLYGAEMAVVAATLGLDTKRVAGNPLANAWHMLAFIPHWAVWPLPVMRWYFPWAGPPMLAFVLAVLAIVTRRLPVWRRLAAAAILVAAAFVATLPIIVTDGYLSARVLTPSLVAVWGGMLVFLSFWHAGRRAVWSRLVAVAALAILWMIHSWAFTLVVAIKNEDVQWAKRLHDDLAARRPAPGDTVNIHAVTFYNTPLVGWGDTGKSLFTTNWGSRAMLWPRAFADYPLPRDLATLFAADRPLPLRSVDHGQQGFVFADGPGRTIVNGNMVVARQMEIEYLFTHPRRQITRRPLGSLAFLGVMASNGAPPPEKPGEQWQKSGYFTGWDDKMRIYPPAHGAWRVYLTAVELDREWLLRARVSLPAEKANPVVVTAGVRLADGSDVELDAILLEPGADPERLAAEGEPHPGALLWIEARMANPDLGNDSAETVWDNARLEMKLSRCPQ